MMKKKEKIKEKTLELLKNNKTVNLIKTAFINFILLKSSIPRFKKALTEYISLTGCLQMGTVQSVIQYAQKN